MLLYDKKSPVDEQIKDLSTDLTNEISRSKIKENDLSKMLEEICDTFGTIQDFDNPDELLGILQDLKSSLDKIQSNVAKLEELFSILGKFKNIKKKDVVSIKIKNYNDTATKYYSEISENNAFIECFVTKYTSFCVKSYKTLFRKNAELENELAEAKQQATENAQALKTIVNNVSDVQANKEPENTIIETKETADTTATITPANTVTATELEEIKISEPVKSVKEEAPTSAPSSDELKDHKLLLISEIQSKVFLPYTLEEVTDILENSNGKYNNIEEIVEDLYTLPIEYFKNPIISRFKEAFYLMKNKEKAPLIDCISLGLELARNSFVHPAIITACHSLDELDIYLDYLDENRPERFDIFKIEYEIPPTKRYNAFSKLGKKSDYQKTDK